MKIQRETYALCAAILALFLSIVSCGPTKIMQVKEEKVAASLVLADESKIPELEYKRPDRDTIIVKGDKGEDLVLMKAIRDESTGEMVATETIEAAVVTARFRNIAERHGKVDLRFDIIVPEKMQDMGWQLRFYPDMFMLGDSTRLESVIVTGDKYRKAQLKGYEQYERFLARIVTDTTKYVNINQLEVFLERNLPDVFAFKTDSSTVSDEVFYSYFGITEQEAVEHYTDRIARYINNRRIANMGKMYRRYVKVPIAQTGIRLDTVMRSLNGDFIYQYVQTIPTQPKLRKVDIVLSGEIYESDQKIYTMSRTEPLTFYISSLSTFTDNRERYLTKVIERRVEANTACYIDFASGKSDIDLSLGHNSEEIARIRGNINDLLEDTKFDLDSIVITASASPEGAIKMNMSLSERRAGSVGEYFRNYIRSWRDSVRRAAAAEGGFSVVVGDDDDGSIAKSATASSTDIPFRSYAGGENWRMLDFLVNADTVMTSSEKERYSSRQDIADIDAREMSMRSDSYYKYMREHLYPRLRTVKFDFHLHRKGMVKDTVHTTVIDSVYMEGVALLKDREYDKALPILRPYADYNAAVCYVSLDMNKSALSILEKMDRTPQVNYLLAVIYSREMRDQEAVQCYLNACSADPTYIHRGNLDPEISSLIREYGLNKTNDDDYDIY